MSIITEAGSVSSDSPIAPYRADWRRGRITSWLTTVDHKRIGVMYLVTSLGFFAFAGLLALIMRAQLAEPNNSVVTRGSYNEVATVHGTTMVFLVAAPLLVGLANFLVPLMIGARRMAFPRLNALAYWFYVLAGALLVLSLLAKNGGPQAGWTSPVPLSTLHADGRGQDMWIVGLYVLTLSSLAAAVNLIVTLTNMRTRGMVWTRLPLFAWAAFISSWLLVVALPTLAAGLTMLLLDRHANTHFFDPSRDGSNELYRHIFWFYGQPQLYALIIPAMGIVSEIIPVFSRKPIFGYRPIVLSSIALAVFGVLTWGQHLFIGGLGTTAGTVFMILSLVSAIPVGVKIFNWLATLWRGNISFDTPMLWAIGFISLFTVGGLSGVLLAVFPVDRQLGGTYFVVAHLHYVLFGGALFAIFGGLYYWWPKIFGRMLDDRLGRLHFWLVFLGFNLAFFPQFFLGLLGMPRHAYTYASGGLRETYNMISTIGSFTIALGMMVFLANVVRTSRVGRRAVNDPWLADTLEWYATSPPPPWNFDRIPYIVGSRPLRDLRRRLTAERRM